MVPVHYREISWGRVESVPRPREQSRLLRLMKFSKRGTGVRGLGGGDRLSRNQHAIKSVGALSFFSLVSWTALKKSKKKRVRGRGWVRNKERRTNHGSGLAFVGTLLKNDEYKVLVAVYDKK